MRRLARLVSSRLSDSATNLLVSMSVTVLSTSLRSRKLPSMGLTSCVPLYASSVRPPSAEPVSFSVAVSYLRVTLPRLMPVTSSSPKRASTSISVSKPLAFAVSFSIIAGKSSSSISLIMPTTVLSASGSEVGAGSLGSGAENIAIICCMLSASPAMSHLTLMSQAAPSTLVI